jgi:hypothetical protein
MSRHISTTWLPAAWIAGIVGIPLALVACGNTKQVTETDQIADAKRTAAPILDPAPEWVRDYCTLAKEVGKPPPRCLTRVPPGMRATPNLRVLRPASSGYAFEGQTSTRHWAFGASRGARSALDPYGDDRRNVGRTRIAGRPAQWTYAGPYLGMFGGHLTLEWRQDNYAYAVSAHTTNPQWEQLRSQLRALARAMATSDS